MSFSLARPRILFAAALTVATLALHGCGGGGSSTPLADTAVPLPPPVEAPATLPAPTQITADAGKARVTLNWSYVPGADSFNLYYGTAPGITTSSARVTDTHSMYIMRDLPNGTTYYFAVAPVGSSGEGRLSAEVSATPSATPPPPAPTAVRAGALNGQVEVSWQPGYEGPASGVTYTVYFGTTPHAGKASTGKLTTMASPQTVSGLANGIAYFFVVTAATGTGESAVSYEVSATPVPVPPPLPPTGVTATEGNGAVTLNWAPSAGATSYNIYYGTEFDVSRAGGIKVAGVSAPHTLSGLANKTAYFFVVTAVSANGEGFESMQVSATPVAVSPVPAMLHIPGGSFVMGDSLADPAASAPYALPTHTVTLSPFSLESHEVTYAQWRSVYTWALSNGYAFDHAGRNGSLEIGTHMPVTQVSWVDVVKWLNARSEMEGRTPVYYTDATQTTVYRTGTINLVNAAVDWAANGYRLPTDAEWEYAARGGLAGKTYPWGDVLSAAMANYDRGTSTSVGSYPANGYGLYDMAGNVWEWTWDRESANYGADAAGVTNPHGNDLSLNRMRRGGSYVYGERYLRNFDKMFRDVAYNGPYFGFRAASSQP